MMIKKINFLPPLENIDPIEEKIFSDYIHRLSGKFDFFFDDHLTKDFRLFDGDRDLMYYMGFADGIRFYTAMKSHGFRKEKNHD